MKIFIPLLILILSITTVNADQLPIAVNDLKGKSLTENELSIISERLRSELFKTGKFRVMERGEMETILEEQQFQLSGACDDASCMVEVGQLLGVSKVVAGSIGKIENFFTISIRIIDVESGEIDASADYDYTGSISGMISSGMEAVSEKLIRGMYGSADVSEVKASPVEIRSTPVGASISIDTLTGSTPFTTTLLPGEYDFALSLDGYKTLNNSITISDGQLFSESFELDIKRERRRGRITRIVSGAVAGTALGMGAYFNSKADQYAQDAQEIADNADNNNSGVDQNDAYLEAKENSDSFANYRNISYIISGTAVTVFAVSFAF